MRDAKRRSNPDGEGSRTGLPRFARNDEGLATITGECCHCESAATILPRQFAVSEAGNGGGAPCRAGRKSRPGLGAYAEQA
ncbi:MAG: hypothetical protein LBT00_11950 [Spirochaetaceae bacterium]|nr:hypothetical protein [Spirochaetaceae bacterium]